ncbi:uncharacterized protein G2W53_024666 [Senna tora]|uniref:Uncharacterized protein n=1 Tax=Senna tora TaxID=362788 RepID=A0A834TDJ8_9FABA|nr:uncharacterized protein G2W53_024666 [Senna tora]
MIGKATTTKHGQFSLKGDLTAEMVVAKSSHGYLHPIAFFWNPSSSCSS